MWRVPGYVGGEPEQPVSRGVVGGMVPLRPSNGRPQWRVDFWVDDVDAVVAKATELGGRAVVPAFDAGFFRQAVIADAAGAEFSVTKVA
jgi:predicted enzyme related to lactoylglutathione lyase